MFIVNLFVFSCVLGCSLSALSSCLGALCYYYALLEFLLLASRLVSLVLQWRAWFSLCLADLHKFSVPCMSAMDFSLQFCFPQPCPHQSLGVGSAHHHLWAQSPLQDPVSFVQRRKSAGWSGANDEL